MRRFRLSPLAKSDLADIRHYIRQDKPTAADRQIATFFRTFRMLAKNFRIGAAAARVWTKSSRLFRGIVCDRLSAS